MLKPILGAALILILCIAFFADNLRGDIAIKENDQGSSQIVSGDAEALKKADNKDKSDGVFSRRASPPSKIGPAGGRELDSFENAQVNNNSYRALQSGNDPSAPSPFVDPNSGFAGASNAPKGTANPELIFSNPDGSKSEAPTPLPPPGL